MNCPKCNTQMDPTPSTKEFPHCNTWTCLECDHVEPEVLSAPHDLIGRVRQLKFWLQELNRIEARIENEEYLQNVLISLGTTPSDKCKFELRKLRKQRDRAKGKVAQLKYKEQ